MAYSICEYTGDGTTTVYAIPFTLGYLDVANITVRVGDEASSDGSPIYRQWELVPGNTGMIKVLGAVPKSGEKVSIVRTVSKTALQHDYQKGEPLDEKSLDESFLQLMMAVHEMLDGRGGKSVVDLDMQGHVIRNVVTDKTDPTSVVTYGLYKELEGKMDDSYINASRAEDAASAAEKSLAAAEACRDAACACATEAEATLNSAVDVIKNQEQLSIEEVKEEGSVQVGVLQDIAKDIIIQATAFNRTVTITLVEDVVAGQPYVLPEELAYLVGASQLFISVNGLRKSAGSDYDYEEVGSAGELSSQVHFLTPPVGGDVVSFTVLTGSVKVLASSGLDVDDRGTLLVSVDGKTVEIDESGALSVPTMNGAAANSAGSGGIVPAPAAGRQGKPLRGDGTWADSLNCNITGNAATATALYDTSGGHLDLQELIDKLSLYLPLTGGTMTGSLTIVDWMIRKYDASGQTGLQFFNPTDSSAYFWLNNTKHASNPGGFMLAASDGTTTKRLQGEITGKLLWDSKNIVRSVNGITADTNGNVAVPISTVATACSGVVAGTIDRTRPTLPNYGTWAYFFIYKRDDSTEDYIRAGTAPGGSQLGEIANPDRTYYIAIRIA